MVLEAACKRPVVIESLPERGYKHCQPVQIVAIFELLLHSERNFQHHIVHVREYQEAEHEKRNNDQPFKVTVRPVVAQPNCRHRGAHIVNH